MDTFHRLAGISSDTPDTHAQPAQPVVPEPPPIPQDDNTDAQSSMSRRTSRVSLPLNRPASQKSLPSIRRAKSSGKGAQHPPPSPQPRQQHDALPALNGAPERQRGQQRGHVEDTTNEDGAEEQEQEQEEEDPFPWGPTHPCFPHPNPHVSSSDPAFHSTRIIRVRRDYLAAGDLCPQYANLYPEILDPLVRDDEFRALISGVNSRLQAAFDPFTARAWLDAVMGVFTGFLWEDFRFTGVKGGVKGVERFLEEWNLEKKREGSEVRVVGLRTTGYLSLDFVVPDPGIDGVGVEGEEEDGRDGDLDGDVVGGIGPAE